MNLLEIAMFGLQGTIILSAYGFCWLAHNRITNLKDELNAYKVEVAQTYSSNGYTAQVESRLTAVLVEIKAELKDQSAKIDRLVERGAAK